MSTPSSQPSRSATGSDVTTVVPVKPRGHLRDDVGLLLIRLGLAAVMLGHGVQKVFGPGGLGATEQSFVQMGIPYAQLSAILLSVLELAGGVAMVFGLLTPLIGVLYAGAMAGAIYYVHLAHGFFATQGGYELAGLVGVVSLGLAIGGAGRISLDRAVFGARRRRRIREAREGAPEA